MSAFSLPKATDAEKAVRTEAIQAATQEAIEVPYRVMELAAGSMEVIKAMVETGNPNSLSDGGVGALCARAAVLGAFMNVQINAKDYNDKAWVEEKIRSGREIAAKAIALENQIISFINEKFGIG